MPSPERATAVRRVREIDWTCWRAVDPVTLVFVVKDRRILLIRKKRGLGAGKINGPGGRLEPGESFDACAVREVREELGVTPLYLEKLGRHGFQFVDGYSTFVHVYRAVRIRRRGGVLGGRHVSQRRDSFRAASRCL